MTNGIVDKNISIINDLMVQNGLPSLVDTLGFNEDQINYKNYKRIIFNQAGYIKLEVCFSNDGMVIGIDRIPEAFGWSINNFDLTEILDTIKMVFENKIKVKQCGRNFTRLDFIDENNQMIKSLRFYTGIFWPFSCEKSIMLPIKDFFIK